MNRELLNIETSEFDVRDLTIESINHPLFEYPAEVDYRKDLPTAWDQGSDGPCSSYAAAAIKTWQELKDYGSTERLSKYFLYNLRVNKPQKGMTPRHTMQLLRKYGIPSAKSYKRRWKDVEDIPQEVLDEALNHRILGYARIMTIDGLKKSIYKNGPAYIAMPVFNDTDTFWKAKWSENILGGHALCVVGYTETGFILRNSWGTQWGDFGHTIYPYSDWGSHYEAWTSIDEKSNAPVIKEKDRSRKKETRKSIFRRFLSIFK